MQRDRISVIVPLYNHAEFITEGIASVLEQGDIVREVIVIDDGSTDSSASVMSELAKASEKIRFRSQQNRGAHATINTGLADASAEYVTILNSDDAFEPGRLAALVRALDLDEGADLAASSITFMDAESAVIENPWFANALSNFKSRRDLAASLIDANFLMTTSNFVMRRKLLDRIGDFAPLRYAHDLEFVLRAAANRVRLAFIDRPLLRYRFHANNTISESHQRVRAEWALAAAAYLHVFFAREGTRESERAATIQAILESHRLTAAVQLALAKLAAHPSEKVDDALIDDEAFRAAILEAAS